MVKSLYEVVTTLYEVVTTLTLYEVVTTLYEVVNHNVVISLYEILMLSSFFY